MLYYLSQTSLRPNSEVDSFVSQRLHSGEQRDSRNGSLPHCDCGSFPQVPFCWTGGPGYTVSAHGSGDAH